LHGYLLRVIYFVSFAFGVIRWSLAARHLAAPSFMVICCASFAFGVIRCH